MCNVVVLMNIFHCSKLYLMCPNRIQSDQDMKGKGGGVEELNKWLLVYICIQDVKLHRTGCKYGIPNSIKQKLFIVYLFFLHNNQFLLQTKLFLSFIFYFLIIYFSFHAKTYYSNSPL